MSISTWIRTSRVRRGLAASIIVLAAGGLVLYRAPARAGVTSAAEPVAAPSSPIVPNGRNAVTFAGPGAHGTLSLSHTKVLAGGTHVFAELTLTADAAEVVNERAPLSLVVVLDTSGSMSGDKIEQAKQSVISLVSDMRDDDEIALVRYSSGSELLQSLARVGDVRSSLMAKVRAIQADGGTNIPPALSHGMRALAEAGKGRVRRVILVSDGLDSTRAMAETIARQSAEQGVTISSLGVGLDFDESYMGAVARSGRGNFVFVSDAAALATFLKRELKETATTTVERAEVRLKLPEGVRFVRATGADVKPVDDGTALLLTMGSLFAGDTRRVVLELNVSMSDGEARSIEGSAVWAPVGREASQTAISAVSLHATQDERQALEGRDGAVFASATSALASIRQMEAAEAYSNGDVGRAQQLIDGNIAALATAQAIAPAPRAAALAKQQKEYEESKQSFAAEASGSMAGKKAAKASAAKSFANSYRDAY
jgi:Ca-activated chloride channel family protein